MSIRATQLTFRSLVAIAVGVLGAAVLSIGLTVWWLRTDAIRDAVRDSSNLATVLSEQTNLAVQSIDLVITEIQGRLKNLGANTQDSFGHLSEDKSTYRLLTDSLSRLSQAGFIGLIDKNGRLMATTQKWPTPHIDVSDRDYFQHFKNNDDKGIYVSKPIADRTKGLQTIIFGKRIDDADNAFLGTILVGVRVSYFHHIYNSIASLPDQSFLLLRADGTVILRYPDPKDRAGVKMPEGSPWYRLVSQGGGAYRSPGYFDGEARLVAVRPLSNYPLVIDVGTSEAAALADWRNHAITIGIGTLLAVVCFIFLLRALTRHTNRLANSEAALADEQAKVDVALRTMSQGLVMFDSSARLVICNRRYLDMYGLSSDIVKPGCTFSELLNHRVASGMFFSDDPQQYVSELVVAAKQGKSVTKITTLRDGRVILIVNEPIANGGWVATHEDITETVNVKNAEAEKKRQLDVALSNMSQGLAMFDAELRLVVCNKHYADLYGLTDEQTKPGTTVRALLEYRVANGNAPKHHENYIEDRLNEAKEGRPFKITDRMRDGRYIAVSHQPMADGGWVTTHEDVTEKINAENVKEENKRQLDAAMSNMSQGLAMFSSSAELVICNRRYLEMYGLPTELVKPGCAFREIIACRIKNDNFFTDDVDAFICDLRSKLDRGLTVKKFAQLRDGRVISIVDHPTADGGWVTTHEDVTELRRAEERISYAAHHDALTDLANRMEFHKQLEEALKRAGRGQQFAVLYLDLDNFKTINDTLGHLTGDELLKAVADRLRGCVRDTDTLARLGGDEFAIIQAAVAQPSDVAYLAVRIQEAINSPYDIAGHQLIVATSIGIAMAPNDGTEPDQLLKNADLAMYQAKADGRGTFCFFEAEMDARVKARSTLEFELRQAIMCEQFELYYQPLIDLHDGKITSFEALLRWHHPERGLISPAEFIPIAEETGLINQLGEWVLRTACAEAATWPDNIKIAVNVSPVQFRIQALASTIVSALAASGLPARRLELEITETAIIHDEEATIAKLAQLRELGVLVALDDFGTGYSSLSYLQRIPFDKIKIDQTFIKNFTDDNNSRAIVQAVITVAKARGVSTVAEGVETERQKELLRTLGCNEAQGYLFSRPLPARDMARFLPVPVRKAAEAVSAA